MLDHATLVQSYTPQKTTKTQNFGRKTVAENERTAGSMPQWDGHTSAKSRMIAGLEHAARQESPFQYVMSYSLDGSLETRKEQQSAAYDFYDVLDVVNPLQHLPVVSTLYRAISGDELKDAPRIIGGAIFGGPVGAVTSVANVVVKEETGRDIAGNIFGLALGEDITTRQVEFDFVRQQPDMQRTADSQSAHQNNFARKAARAYAERYNS